MGRGISATRYPLDCDLYILVNEWDNVINRDRVFAPLWGENFWHIVNREHTAPMSREAYKQLRIDGVTCNTHGTEFNESPIAGRIRAMGLEPRPLDAPMIEYSQDGDGGYPSTGILAVVWAATRSLVDRVDICGIDFFEAEYYAHHSHTRKKEVADYQPRKGPIMKQFLMDFCDQIPTTTFMIWTDAEFDCPPPNLITCPSTST